MKKCCKIMLQLIKEGNVRIKWCPECGAKLIAQPREEDEE